MMFKPGDTVIFEGYTQEAVRWGGNDEPRMLMVGNTYIISEVRTHSSHTKLILNGVVGRFNSVHFRLYQ